MQLSWSAGWIEYKRRLNSRRNSRQSILLRTIRVQTKAFENTTIYYTAPVVTQATQPTHLRSATILVNSNSSYHPHHPPRPTHPSERTTRTTMHAQFVATILFALPLLSTATPVPVPAKSRKGGSSSSSSNFSKSESLAAAADIMSIADSGTSIANNIAGDNNEGQQQQQPAAKKTKAKRAAVTSATDHAQMDLDNVMSIISHTLHVECFLQPEVCEENDGVVEKMKLRKRKRSANARNGNGIRVGGGGGAGGSLTDGSLIAAACELYGDGACDLWK